MEESEIKSELKCEGNNYVSASPEAPGTPENLGKQESTDGGTVVKKRRMEIELDFSLLNNKYYKPRDKKPMKRYQDTYAVETNRKKDEHSYKKTDDDIDLLICEICNGQYKGMRALKNHRLNKHYQKNKLTCALCSETFDSNEDLIMHKAVHQDEDKNFLCMQCKIAFSDHLEYLKHAALHQKNSNFYCIECGKDFDYRRGYYLHIQRHYDIKVECDVCHAQINALRLNDHKKTHNDTHKIKCVECDKVYEKVYMEYHMTSHTGVKRHQCLYCGRCFGNRGQKNVHTRTHTGEQPFQCNICKRKFVQSGDLNRHTKANHVGVENLMKCEVCGKIFKHKQSFKNHMDIHNNTMRYVCKICGMKVNTHTGLRSHIQRAHMEKTYKCVPCGVAFKTPSDLLKHKKWKKHKNNQFGYDKRIKDEKENNHEK